MFGIHELDGPFVGRGQELSRLDQALALAVSTQAPRLVSVIGPAGIGKTRLLGEWLERLGRRDHDGDRARPIVYRGGAPEGAGRYGVIARLLRDRFGIADGDDHDRMSEKMRAELQQVFGDRRVSEVAHFLGLFLGLPARDSPFLRALEDEPRQHDRIARTVLRRFIEFDARRAPLVLAFDDLHFADDDSVDLVGELAAELQGSPVVLVAVARPELFARHGRFGDATAHARLDLPPLGRAESEELLRARLAGIDSLPRALVDDACEMTSGNPFFVEELVRVFFAEGVVVREEGEAGGRLRIDVARARKARLPVTVEEAIQARIAALGSAERDLLEKAALFGNVFWSGALLSLWRVDRDALEKSQARRFEDGDRAEIERRLDELADRDYLLRMPDSTMEGEREYVFKHNLERDLVVRMTPPDRARRAALFAAQWLETHLEGSDERLEFLAALYERGGSPARAAAAWLRAGDGSRARFENDVAAGFYERGLKLLPPDDVLARVDALHNLGDVVARKGRTREALGFFEEMLRAAWLLDHRAKAGAAHGRIGRCYRTLGEYDRAEYHLGLALGLFSKAGDHRGVASAEDDLGKVSFLRGDYARALERHGRALDMRRALGEPRSIALALHNLGQVARASGKYAEAMARFDEALALRREVGDKQGTATSLEELGTVRRERGEAEQALALFRQGLELAKEIGDRMIEAQLENRLGEALAFAGHPDEASAALLRAAEAAEALGDRLAQAESLRLLCECRLAMGDPRTAREHGQKALDLADRIGSRHQRALAHRALGAALAVSLVEEDLVAADRHFRFGIELLSDLGHDGDLLRAFRSYGAFLERRGEPDAAAAVRLRADEVQVRIVASSVEGGRGATPGGG